MKTTIEGIARGMADYALVLVNASQPPTHMTVHHLKLCSNMGIPVIVLLTKADRSPSHVFQSTKKEISRILKSHPDLGLKRPFVVKTQKDIELVQNKLTNAAVLVPIISISCVTGEGMDVLQQLLVNLPQRRHHATKQRTKPFEFLIEDIYHQVPGVGTVISGFVSRGEWNKGEALYIGPLKDGTIFKATPKSTHVAQSFVDRVWAGHSVCFAIPKPPKGRRLLLSKKGMVAMKEPFQFSNEFVADIYLTKGQTVTIQKNRFAPTIQLLHNKVTGKVVNIVIRDTIHGGGLSKEAETIRQGDRATVTFQVHKHRPAFVRPGMRVILREGHVLGYGIVLSSKTV